MRLFINLFLILFAVDSLISVVDELLLLFADASNLSGGRELFAGMVILLSLPAYLLLGVDKRLPKRVLLPLIFFIVWSLLAAWVFPGLADNRTYNVLCPVAQLLLCILPLEYVRRIGGGGLLIPESAFKPPFFSIRHSLYFAAVSLFVIPAVTVMLALASADAYAGKATSGFIRVAPDGLNMAERVYQRDNKTIRLTGMIHVGDQKFYDEMADAPVAGRTIILAEGVTDESHCLKNRFGYGKMAGFLGLSSQEKMQLNGRLVESADNKEHLPEKNASTGSDILMADIDVSDFDSITISFLNKIGKLLNESNSFASSVMAINQWAEKELTPEMDQTIMDDILHKRNKVVIRHMDTALAGYDTVVIPWGALHMVEIEEAVLKRGFVMSSNKYRVSMDFRKMLVALLVNK